MKRLHAYAQLLRVPNLFTAAADVALGTMLAIHHCGAASAATLAAAGGVLILASACFYSAGMALNDFFDAEEDRRDRPYRPIPSGRIARRSAGVLGVGLLAAGLALTAGITPLVGGLPLALGGLLTGAIVAYDSGAKRTPAGPIVMGLCRSLNVLLGVSLIGGGPPAWTLHASAAVGVYIAGVTWFAGTEATMSRRRHLLGATAVIVAAALMGLLLPLWPEVAPPPEARWFPPLLCAWAVWLGLAIVRAVRSPVPENVQAAIKRCLLGLIGLDALLAFAVVGWFGLSILALAVPALVLGRWVYLT
jgi:4-hydroxybenzoate polyprenyltransferase